MHKPPPRALLVSALLAFVFLVGIFPLQVQEVEASNLLQTASVSQTEQLLADGQFVFGPNVGSFDLEQWISANYPHLNPYVDSISSVADYDSINPKVYVVLIEQVSASVTDSSAKAEEDILALGNQNFDSQIELVSQELFDKFYWHLYEYSIQPKDERQPLEITTASGRTVVLQDDVNSATFAVISAQNLLGIAPKDWLGFTDTYRGLFPGDDPLNTANVVAPYKATPPFNFQFPFPIGESWIFNGIHNWNGSYAASDMSSIDFSVSPKFPTWGTPTNNWWVVAAAPGIAEKKSNCLVVVTHEGGWETVYYHVWNVQFTGSVEVDYNDKLATLASTQAQATCNGGSGTGIHLHFSVKRNGVYVPMNGIEFSGWRMNSGAYSYDNNCSRMFATRGADKRCAFQYVLNDAEFATSPEEEALEQLIDNLEAKQPQITLEDLSIPITESYVSQGNQACAFPPITTEVTINGNGAELVYDSSEDMSIFCVQPSGKLTINNLTIRGGRNGLTYGAAIASRGQVALENVVFDDNRALYGGAIYNMGALTIGQGVTFNANRAQSGGAIYTTGDLYMEQSKFLNNHVILSGNGSSIYSTGNTEARSVCFQDNNRTSVYATGAEVNAMGNWWNNPGGANMGGDATGGSVNAAFPTTVGCEATTLITPLKALGTTLVNAETDQDVMLLTPGMAFSLDSVNMQRYFNLRVDVQGEVYQMGFEGTYKPWGNDSLQPFNQIEDFYPFSAFGDQPTGDYRERLMRPGTYQFTAMPYRENGEPGKAVDMTFTVLPPPIVVNSFDMMDTQTETAFPLVDGTTFVQGDATIPDKFTVIANATNYTEEVQLKVWRNGKEIHRRTEYFVPYSLFGNLQSFNARNLRPGTYTIEATPRASVNGMKITGETASVTFTVIKSDEPVIQAAEVIEPEVSDMIESPEITIQPMEPIEPAIEMEEITIGEPAVDTE